jgi:hypothetical protein
MSQPAFTRVLDPHVAILVAVLLSVSAAAAQVLVRPEKAMSLAFPKAKFSRTTLLVSEKERAAIARLAKVRADDVPGVTIAYVAKNEETGTIEGFAFFDKHGVRSKYETLMVAVDLDGGMRRVEECAVAEPIQYKPAEPFYRQFDEKTLYDLGAGKGVMRVTGATLTVEATLQCCRRILAARKILAESDKLPENKPKSEGPDRP